MTPHHGGTNQNSGSENDKTLVMLIVTWKVHSTGLVLSGMKMSGEEGLRNNAPMSGLKNTYYKREHLE